MYEDTNFLQNENSMVVNIFEGKWINETQGEKEITVCLDCVYIHSHQQVRFSLTKHNIKTSNYTISQLHRLRAP